MIECTAVQKSVVRWHYDLSTVFYRMLWGPHIHHGLWQNAEHAQRLESPGKAQVQLTETLADLAGVSEQTKLADIGCGMGGSSIHLARTRHCRATGVTISPLQRRWAATIAMLKGVRSRTQFICADAEEIAFDHASFDVVWSIECTEHLFDKPAFFRKAYDWLKPGGRMAICAWLAGENLDNADKEQQVYDVCEGFFCPSLGSAEDYIGWMRDAGMQITGWHDWTRRVERTWDVCEQRVRRTGVRWLAKAIDQDTVMFLDRFRTLRDAYTTGAMQYGCFVAEKPTL
ncbi:MAG: methyltransferase domain-containing protein [Planctomycetales bacterium]|nr:methyltransferase domain-containing protein [Planctomycetales bacterium]